MCMLPGMKRCPACERVKPPEAFYTDRSRRDRLSSCRDCEILAAKVSA